MPIIQVASDSDLSARDTARAFIETTKPGITKLVTITAAAGFVLAWTVAPAGTIGEMLLLGLICLVGTASASGGANALNQWLEPKLDACMPRTRNRPIPSARLSRKAVYRWGLFLSILGISLLGFVCGPVPALLALICIVSYVFLYTPMKTRSWTNTLLGTIPGALPPMIGWTAVTSAQGLSTDALLAGASLALFMTAWQLPHFFSLAWMYREQYAAAGFRMLPEALPSARMNGVVVFITALLLFPAAALPFFLIPSLGWTSFTIAMLATIYFAFRAFEFLTDPSDTRARTVFLASILHLPIVLGAMVAEGVISAAFF